MPFATISGLRFHHHLYGQVGEPLVFVHGYTGDSTGWRYPVEEFSSDYRVVCRLEQRGAEALSARN